jgi:hypothetical protein
MIQFANEVCLRSYWRTGLFAAIVALGWSNNAVADPMLFRSLMLETGTNPFSGRAPTRLHTFPRLQICPILPSGLSSPSPKSGLWTIPIRYCIHSNSPSPASLEPCTTYTAVPPLQTHASWGTRSQSYVD